MSDESKGTQSFMAAMTWLMPAAVAGVAVAGVISYVRSEETQVAGGSPLYGKAVHEALDGLKNPAAKPAPDARTPLPAGLSPDDYYWCEKCKAYHPKQAAQGQPAGVVPPPVAGSSPAQAVVVPGTQAAVQASEVIPPLPAGLSPNDYYWCANCKAYHPRQAAPGQPADTVHSPPAGTAPAMPVAQPNEAIPPLPAGLAAADYYWCPNCKAYHPRQPASGVSPDGIPYRLEPPPAVPAPAPAPVSPVTPPPVAPLAPVAPAAPGTAPPAAPAPATSPAPETSGQ